MHSLHYPQGNFSQYLISFPHPDNCATVLVPESSYQKWLENNPWALGHMTEMSSHPLGVELIEAFVDAFVVWCDDEATNWWYVAHYAQQPATFGKKCKGDSQAESALLAKHFRGQPLHAMVRDVLKKFNVTLA